MTPHLVRWNSEYAPKGLKILYVYDDEGGSSPLDDVRAHVAAAKISYAVLHDPTGVAAGSYRVNSFPRAFVINRAGKIVWAGNPGGSNAKRVEAAISKALGS